MIGNKLDIKRVLLWCLLYSNVPLMCALCRNARRVWHCDHLPPMGRGAVNLDGGPVYWVLGPALQSNITTSAAICFRLRSHFIEWPSYTIHITVYNIDWLNICKHFIWLFLDFNLNWVDIEYLTRLAQTDKNCVSNKSLLSSHTAHVQ